MPLLVGYGVLALGFFAVSWAVVVSYRTKGGSLGQLPVLAQGEEMVRRRHAIDRRILNDLKWEPFAWEKGERLEEGRKLLRELLEKRGGGAGS